MPLDKLATDWAEGCDKIILRRCPVCKQDSIIGHGCRRKQAHDEYHDWIAIRRGRCAGCGTTFTFLPLLSLPYSQRQLVTYTANMQTSLIGMEACSGAHFLGRALRKQGHDVRLIAAQFVKAFVKSNKNDRMPSTDPGQCSQSSCGMRTKARCT